jgi:ubiquinone/menaquinone biosynthesis C-methylase UbiE
MRLSWLDPWVARRPFEGRSARRYADAERPAFADLDDRLLERLGGELARAERFLDVGAGTGALAARIARAHPRLQVVAVEPSRTFASGIRARAEALPLAPASIDVALCLTSLRHVRDRAAALVELRRVVRGAVWIVELDPAADAARARRHRRALRSTLARLAFDPFVLRTGPDAAGLAAAARAAGWVAERADDDPLQPFFILHLT